MAEKRFTDGAEIGGVGAGGAAAVVGTEADGGTGAAAGEGRGLVARCCLVCEGFGCGTGGG